MRSDLAPTVTRDCLFAKKAFAYDALGRPKGKCVMGARADCSRCGCIVPFYLRSLTDRRLIASDLLGEASRGLGRMVGRA
jgi:hypothetical protein